MSALWQSPLMNLIKDRNLWVAGLTTLSAAFIVITCIANQSVYLDGFVSQQNKNNLFRKWERNNTKHEEIIQDSLGYLRYGVTPSDQDNIKIFYNRIPKTGSEAVLSVAHHLSKMNNFTCITSDVYDQFEEINAEYQARLVRDISTMTEPLFYDRHVVFIDFESYGWKLPIYINTVRDPVQRQVSGYYYLRYTKLDITEPNRRDMSFDECVQLRHDDCINTDLGVVKWFCGTEDLCWEKDQRKIAKAKHNLEKYYTVVGLTEELDSFFLVLEKLLPRFFKTAHELYIQQKQHLHEKYKAVKKDNISQHSMEVMKEVLKDEYEIYHFAQQKYKKLKKKLGIQ